MLGCPPLEPREVPPGHRHRGALGNQVFECGHRGSVSASRSRDQLDSVGARSSTAFTCCGTPWNNDGANHGRPALTCTQRQPEPFTNRFLLLVYRLDRFSRRIRDLATLMDELDTAGVHFRSATEPFDTTSPAGRLFVQMLGAFAEFEREVIIDRVINGMERKAAKGEWTHGPRPYGYQVDRNTHRLVPHPQEQHVVKEIFTLYAETRLGTRAIAQQLNAQGKRTRKNKPWSGLTIGRMLNNRLYLGEVVFRDITTPGAHPALVEPNLFEQCQAILTARGEAHSQRAASNSDYHLTGLITCPICGNKYIGTAATGKLRRYRYYTCFARTRYGPAGCTAARIDADLLDRAVQQALIDFYSRTDFISAAIAAEQTRRADGNHRHHAELHTMTGKITATEKAIDRYLTAFENGTLDERACGHRIRDLTIKLDQLRTRRDELNQLTCNPPSPPSPQAVQQLRDHLTHVLTTGTPGQRKTVIETHIAEIKIDGDRLIPIFKIPAGHDTGPAEPSTDPGVRPMHQVVEPRGLEPLTPTLPVWRHTLPRTAKSHRAATDSVYGRPSIVRPTIVRASPGVSAHATAGGSITFCPTDKSRTNDQEPDRGLPRSGSLPADSWWAVLGSNQ